MLHRKRLWGRPLLAACVAFFCVGAAHAQDEDYETLPQWYIGALAGQLLPDSARQADAGPNLHVVLGLALGEALAVELNGFGSQAKSSIAGVDDQTLQGGGLDLTLGTQAPGNPLFMIGGGALSHEIAGQKASNAFGHLGLGAYLPFTFAGELWRLEGRYHIVFNDHPALAAEEVLEDGRINLGVLLPFGQRETVAGLEPAELAPDADGDGVADALDQCPDTPRWIRPDAKGCSPDADGDGIDDGRDQCPESPAGSPVDGTGCEPKPPVAQALTDAGPLDGDNDGVPDNADACPDTTPRLDIDDKGCVKPETVQLRNVHFDLESSRLTGDGFTLLRQIAAAMRADPALRLEVSGHADASGTSKYNQKISLERAEVVHDFLNYLGIAEDRMQVKAYGETRPVADNKTDEGRAYNRRVEFRRLD